MTQSAASGVDMKTEFPHSGRLRWIGLRPDRLAAMQVVQQAEVSLNEGIVGDRFAGQAGATRQVTLIQQEHLDAVAELLRVDCIRPELTRRNLGVAGINLTALKGSRFSIGEVVLLGTGPCPPCSRMEENLGRGGFNAMRGHGGITASVIQGGTIREGDDVTFIGVGDA